MILPCLLLLPLLQAPQQPHPELERLFAQALDLPSAEVRWGFGSDTRAALVVELHVVERKHFLPQATRPGAADLARLRDLVRNETGSPVARVELAEALRTLGRADPRPSANDPSPLPLLRQAQQQFLLAERALGERMQRSPNEADALLQARVLKALNRHREARDLLDGLIRAERPSWRAMLLVARDEWQDLFLELMGSATRDTWDDRQSRMQRLFALVSEAVALAPGEPGPLRTQCQVLMLELLQVIATRSFGEGATDAAMKARIERFMEQMAEAARRLRELPGNADDLDAAGWELLARATGKMVARSSVPGSDSGSFWSSAWAAFAGTATAADLASCQRTELLAARAIASGHTEHGRLLALLSALLRGDAARLEAAVQDLAAASPGFREFVEAMRCAPAADGSLEEVRRIALAMAPQTVSDIAPRLLGAAAYRLGDMTLAVAQFRLAMARSGETIANRLGYGLALLRGGGADQEAAALLRSVAEAPVKDPREHALAATGLALVALRASDLDLACNHIATATQVLPDAQCLQLRGELEYARALRLQPSDARRGEGELVALRNLVQAVELAVGGTDAPAKGAPALVKECTTRALDQAGILLARGEGDRTVLRFLARLLGEAVTARIDDRAILSAWRNRLLAVLRQLEARGLATDADRLLLAETALRLAGRDATLLAQARGAAEQVLAGSGGEDLAALRILGLAARMEQRHGSAVACFERALAVSQRIWGEDAFNPTIDWLEQQLLRTCIESPEDEFIGKAMQLVLRQSGRPMAGRDSLSIAAMLALAAQQAARAIEFCKRALERDPADLRAHCLLSLALHESGDHAAALQALDAARAAMAAHRQKTGRPLDPDDGTADFLVDLLGLPEAAGWVAAVRGRCSPEELRWLGL